MHGQNELAFNPIPVLPYSPDGAELGGYLTPMPGAMVQDWITDPRDAAIICLTFKSDTNGSSNKTIGSGGCPFTDYVYY